MSEVDKEMDRFGFTNPDSCIQVSQCVECANNKGKLCAIFGEKPIEYVRASAKTDCPKRKK